MFPHPCGTRLGVCKITRYVNTHEAIFTTALLACGTFCFLCFMKLYLFGHNPLVSEETPEVGHGGCFVLVFLFVSAAQNF